MTIRVSLDFKKLANALLFEFCTRVIFKMDGKAAYAMMQPQVDALKVLVEEFNAAVLAASDGGKSLIKARKESRLKLLAAMGSLAALVKGYANGSESFVTEAGFSLIEKPVRNTDPLPKPEWKYLRQGKLSGTIEGEVTNFPKGVTDLCIKKSIDAGLVFVNGTNSSCRKFVISNLEIEKPILVKLCFNGTFQRTSDDSDTKRIFVL